MENRSDIHLQDIQDESLGKPAETGSCGAVCDDNPG